MTDSASTPSLPVLCRTLAEAAIHARRPFTPELVQAKIHTAGETWAEIAYYVDARAVIDRLNVILPGQWEAHFEPLTASALEGERAALVYRCRLRVLGVVFTDVGEGADHKAAHSDALKRAAVHVGIGHCIYRVPGPRMGTGEGAHQLRRSRKGRPYLDDANREWLKRRYRAWLIADGVAEYGLPLDHGQCARALAPDLFPEWATRTRAPLAANGSGTQTPGAATAERAQRGDAGATGLVAIQAASAEQPPAPPADRAALLDEAAERGYGPATLELLARVACGATVEQLTVGGVEVALGHLRCAADCGVDDESLRAKLGELGVAPDPKVAAGRLVGWLATLRRAA